MSMIVRINQFHVAHAEQQAGWEPHGLQGPLDFNWPDDAHAFELLILPEDEQSQPLARSFRQMQLRQLIPDIAAALLEEQEHLVWRLDGPLAEGELIGCFKYLTDARGTGRFAVSPVQKFEDDGDRPTGSIRLYASLPRIAALCADPNVGLVRSVRLRAFSVPEGLINPLLDTADADDERWQEIVPQMGFALSTVRAMQGIHLVTRRFTPDETKTRLMSRLVGGAALS